MIQQSELLMVAGGAPESTTLRLSTEQAQFVEQTYRDCYDRLYAMIYRRCSDHHLTEEILGQVFLKLSLKVGEFRGDAHIFTWLYKVAQNCLRDHRRKQARLLMHCVSVEVFGGADSFCGDSDAFGPDEFELEIVRDRLNEAIGGLAPRASEIMRLRLLERKTIREISVELGISVGAVKSVSFNAFRKIAVRLRVSVACLMVH